MSKSGGRVVVKEVPNDKIASADSFRKLETEIGAQISANVAVCNRSMQFASRSVLN